MAVGSDLQRLRVNVPLAWKPPPVWVGEVEALSLTATDVPVTVALYFSPHCGGTAVCDHTAVRVRSNEEFGDHGDGVYYAAVGLTPEAGEVFAQDAERTCRAFAAVDGVTATADRWWVGGEPSSDELADGGQSFLHIGVHWFEPLDSATTAAHLAIPTPIRLQVHCDGWHGAHQRADTAVVVDLPDTITFKEEAK